MSRYDPDLDQKSRPAGPKKGNKGKKCSQRNNFATNQELYTKFPHPTCRITCRCTYAKNEVNWAKNDRVRAVFVDNVKTLENKSFTQNRNF